MLKGERNKFSIEKKKEIVQAILNGTDSYNSIAKKFKTTHRLVSLWVSCFKTHGLDGLSFKKTCKLTGDFKLNLLSEMNDKGLSLYQVSVKYLISPSVICNWKRQYERDGVSAFCITKPKGRPPKMKKKPKVKRVESHNERDELIKENERLRAENDFLKKLQALIQKQKNPQND